MAKDSDITKKQTTGVIADVVCPACYRALQHPHVDGTGLDRRRGVVIRTYYGWCFECERGWLVIQFMRDGRWLIHKYREAKLPEGQSECKLADEWVIVCDLPQPDAVKDTPQLVMTDAPDPSLASCLQMCRLLTSMLESATQTMVCLAKSVGVE